MKLPFLKSVAFPLLIATIFLLSTAQKCDGDGNGNQLPECWTIYEKQPTVDLKVSSVNLSYYISNYAHNYNYSEDFSELATAHYIDYNGTGKISYLSNILNSESAKYTGNGAPEITLWFQASDCQNKMSKTYTADEVDVNTLKNSPAIVKNLTYVSYRVRSIKTDYSGIQLTWDPEVMISADSSNVVFNRGATSSVDVTRAAISTRSKLNRVAVRKNSATKADGQTVSVVENTVQEGTASGYVRKSSDEMIISPMLQKEIYVGGKPDKNIAWNAPEWYEIMK